MKTMLALTAALLLFGGGRALAQGYQGQPDSYVCSHGDPADPATAEACGRLKAGSGDQAASLPPAPPPAPINPLGTAANQSMPATAPSPFDDQTASRGAVVAKAKKPEARGSLNAATNDAAAANDDDQGNAEISIDTSSYHWPWSWLRALGALAVVVVVIAIFSGLAVYFLPTLIAMMRRKRNAPAIFVLNLFLGWSFIGWVVALVWSLAVDSR
jgi:hypothetical protein